MLRFRKGTILPWNLLIVIFLNVKPVQKMNLTRLLLALVITMMILPLSTMSFRYAADLSFDYNEINDQIALYQLREILLIAYDLELSADCLSFIYQNDEFRLSLVNNKLILQPGTQIFLNEIDSLYFYENNDTIHLHYQRNSHSYDTVLASAERFYLDRFSACDVSDDEPDRPEE